MRGYNGNGVGEDTMPYLCGRRELLILLAIHEKIEKGWME